MNIPHDAICETDMLCHGPANEHTYVPTQPAPGLTILARSTASCNRRPRPSRRPGPRRHHGPRTAERAEAAPPRRRQLSRRPHHRRARPRHALRERPLLARHPLLPPAPHRRRAPRILLRTRRRRLDRVVPRGSRQDRLGSSSRTSSRSTTPATGSTTPSSHRPPNPTDPARRARPSRIPPSHPASDCASTLPSTHARSFGHLRRQHPLRHRPRRAGNTLPATQHRRARPYARRP